MLGLFAVILLASISAVKSESVVSCVDQRTIDKCLETEGPFPFARVTDLPDEDFLDYHCSPSIQMHECFRDAVQKCPELNVHVYGPNTMTAIEMSLVFLHSVCDEDSELKKRYLENVACYDTVYDRRIQCNNTTRETVEGFIKSLNSSEVENFDLFWCIWMPFVTECVVEETTKICGASAASPLGTILTQFYLLDKKLDCPSDDELAVWQAHFALYLLESSLQLRK